MSIKNNLLILFLVISISTFVRFANPIRSVDFVMVLIIGFLSGVLLSNWATRFKSR